jgi:DNA-binding response OmpR family regulator
MRKILVIEDEPEMRRNLTTILRLENLYPLAAENGRIGVELAKKEKPDLILCDVKMPELDGYGVIAALRGHSETAAIPFIFLTAKGKKSDIRTGMNLGADDYLIKPVSKADLMASIRFHLKRALQQTMPEFEPISHADRPWKEMLGLPTLFPSPNRIRMPEATLQQPSARRRIDSHTQEKAAHLVSSTCNFKADPGLLHFLVRQ